MGHIQSICKITAHLSASSNKLCNLNPSNLGDSSNHILSLLTASTNSLHIQKRLYFSSSAHDFIVDFGSIKSVISVEKLESVNPNTGIQPNKVSTSTITGHKSIILGCHNLFIGDDKSSIINCEFLITERETSILGLENLRMLQGQLCVLTTRHSSNKVLDNFLVTESKCGNLRTTLKPRHLILKQEMSRP